MSWVQIHKYLHVDAQPSQSVEVRIAGEIDLGSVGAARRAIDNAAAAISGEVELDMSRVTFIDGTGLDMLDDLKKELADGDRDLLIRMPSRATRRLMELTGMTDEYRIEMGSPSQPPELHADGIQVLDEALEGLLRQQAADKGNVQLVDPETAALRIACQRGFDRHFLSFFEIVHDRESACGAALLDKTTVPVPDVTQWPEIADTPSLDVVMDAGVRAVVSTPLRVRDGRVLGVISVHYAQVQAWDDDQINAIAEFAATAAEAATGPERVG